jgi:hypothetical protein
MDAFWVEATLEEAEIVIFPRLQPEAVAESKSTAERQAELAKSLGCDPYCFLVARDLSSIDPYQVHYPFHQLWNGYSPFEEMSRKTICRMEELADIVLPSRDSVLRYE